MIDNQDIDLYRIWWQTKYSFAALSAGQWKIFTTQLNNNFFVINARKFLNNTNFLIIFIIIINLFAFY